jgi:hypothetical protein
MYPRHASVYSDLYEKCLYTLLAYMGTEVM